jgi:hypothetical protein
LTMTSLPWLIVEELMVALRVIVSVSTIGIPNVGKRDSIEIYAIHIGFGNNKFNNVLATEGFNSRSCLGKIRRKSYGFANFVDDECIMYLTY